MQVPRHALSTLSFNPLATQFLEPLTFCLLTSLGTFTVDVTRPVDKLRARLRDADGAAGFFTLPAADGPSSGMDFLAPTPMQRRQTMHPEEELERLLNNQVYSREACATAMVVAAGFSPTDLGTMGYMCASAGIGPW